MKDCELRVAGLGPEVPPRARVLILGSLPGQRSIQRAEYYAHPRNQFWPVMQRILGIDPKWPYRQRISSLNSWSIGLWDVVGSCQRRGSLDSEIRPDSIRCNDIASILARSRSEGTSIICNGALAAALCRAHVLPQLSRPSALLQAPSTSPAHARLSLDAKVEQWASALGKGFSASRV